MSASPAQLFGAPYSVYVRAARLALEEKGVPYELIPIDIFAQEGRPRTTPRAIHSYAFPPSTPSPLRNTGDHALRGGFEGPRLTPDDAMARARMQQVMSILDAHAYRTLVWGIYFERVEAPLRGRTTDEARIAATLPRARVCLAALDALLDGRDWFGGERSTVGCIRLNGV